MTLLMIYDAFFNIVIIIMKITDYNEDEDIKLMLNDKLKIF